MPVLVEEVCEGGKIGFVPTYGNTPGLARHHPIGPENDYSVAYYAPQPRAVLRVINPETNLPVEYDTWGRVELTTLTKEFFYAPFSRARRSLATKTMDRSTMGWSCGGSTIRGNGKENRRRSLLI